MFDLLPESWLGAFVTLNQLLMYAVTVVAATVALFKMVRHKSGSLLALTGCVALFAGTVISYRTRYEYAWALGFCMLIILLTVWLSRRMAQQNRLRQESELRGARLELELLKKHIQPHFLLNSLNSIIAWLEENPATAGRLVHSLAEELRAILDFSREKLIPVNEELRLCRLHLEVMGFRQDKQFTLVVDEIPDAEKIPPLVFHTLVENGLTHGCAGEFFVKRTEGPADVHYAVFNTGTKPLAPAGEVREGTRIRYVKTRLQEAFGDAWSISYGPRENGWEVIIKVPVAGKK
jgi:LytS/YehU family sensor histidine kinase